MTQPTIAEIAMQAHKMCNLEVVIDLPFLLGEINDAHRQVVFHGRSMLLEAKRAGEALVEVKRLVKHGEFKEWVKANCGCSYSSAWEYMRVAKLAKNLDLRIFEPDLSIRAFLDAHSTPRQPDPQPAPKFTRDDAERAFKLHALAERGATEGERKAASKKLAEFSERFGMTPEQLVVEAQAFLPDATKTAHQQRADAARAATKQAREEVAGLKAKLEQMLKRKAELRAEFAARTHDELVDLLANAYLALEEAGLG